MHAGTCPTTFTCSGARADIYIDMYNDLHSQTVHGHLYRHAYLSDSSETELGSVTSAGVQKMAPPHDCGDGLETYIQVQACVWNVCRDMYVLACVRVIAMHTDMHPNMRKNMHIGTGTRHTIGRLGRGSRRPWRCSSHPVDVEGGQRTQPAVEGPAHCHYYSLPTLRTAKPAESQHC